MLVSVAAMGQVSFRGLDLSGDNQLLFSASVTPPSVGSFDTLFVADLPEDVREAATIEQLTIFPEFMTYLPESGRLQLQTRFGLFRSSDGLSGLAPVADYGQFVTGDSVPQGKLMPITASPDGTYLVQTEATGVAYGDLVLIEPATGQRIEISSDVELSFDGPRAIWSPDSSFFVYEKRGGIYYYSISQLTGGRVIDEAFRRIGPGSLASVSWASDGSLYYVQDRIVYRILGVEFFTRSLYSDLLRIGTIVGKLPFGFDPSFDQFWVSPDAEKVILNKGGRNLFMLYLRADDYADFGQGLGLPSLLLPRNTRVKTVLWSASDHVTVLADSIDSGDISATIYRLDLSTAGGDAEATAHAFEPTERGTIAEVVMSPDQTAVAALYDDRVEIKSTVGWQTRQTISVNGPLQTVWVNDDQLLIAGRSVVELVDLTGGGRSLVAISQVDDYGFAVDGSIVVEVDEQRYRRDDGAWVAADDLEIGEPSVASSSYRVYLETVAAGEYHNLVMVRSATSAGTRPLFNSPQTSFDPFPSSEQALDLEYFTHGSRLRLREVALTFNAIDSVDGLTEILTTLDAYGIRATFFVNGEFIRRHPSAVREIAESGHEVGSLFYVYFDMTDRRYDVTGEFVVQGLARNEDDYYEITGRELSLLWHAPYYFVSDEIIAAGQQANYVYVGRDVDSLDWVPRRTDAGVSVLYMPAADLIERIVEEKQPGSIISMTVGVPSNDQGERQDYLFHRLDVLINALIDRGYSMVPVSTLIERVE